MRAVKIDKVFLTIVVILVCAGFFIFSSASLGLLARDGARLSSVAFSQLFFGVIAGSVAAYVTSIIPFRLWRKYAFHLLIFAILLTVLVFIPGIGQAHGGANRWIDILGFSFQPAEFLKLVFVIYFAAWLSGIKERIIFAKYGLLPFIALLGIIGCVLLSQPDTDTFGVIVLAGIGMYLAAGGKWRDIAILVLIGIAVLAVLSTARPYLMDRLYTFVDPARDPLGAGYQVQQSLIAIGSGGFSGRGFGQSIQKFNYLPEPTSDSIFAVAGEEFGFIGSAILILLYVFFSLRGLKIAADSHDSFGRLLVVGIVIIIVSQSFINIASMLGIIPLSGLPLLFVSHGGTAMLSTLAAIGIVLNVSKHARL